jgi:hypothetical protein
MSLKFPVRPKNFADVAALSTAASASQPETIPWVYYDTQDFVSNWTRVSFFATPQNDRTLGNIEQGGTIPADTYFQIFSLNVDFLIAASASTAAPAAAIADDLAQILFGSRAILNLTIANKNYGPIPLTYCHSSGGLIIDWQGTPAAAAILNFAQNAPADGGYWVDGAIILPPNQSFTMTVEGVAAALVATRKVRLSMAGVKYRPVR